MIRSETPDDYEAVRTVNEQAFGRPVEADLVDVLRSGADPFISLVAVHDGRIVGHIAFSPVTIRSESDTVMAMGLGPMGVLPPYQGKGIGSMLVREGLAACKRSGHHVVFVLGHPTFYPRFGFVPAATRGIRCTYDVPDDVFMVAELTPGALNGRIGTVEYHPAFADAE